MLLQQSQTRKITQLSMAEVQCSFNFQGVSGDAGTEFYLLCNSKNVDIASHDAYYLLSVTFSLGDVNITAVLLTYRCVR